ALPNREVQHINHFTVKPATISVGRESLGQVIRCAFAENNAVKNRIDDITQSSCQNKCYGKSEQFRAVLFDGVVKPVQNSAYGNNPEQCQSQFAVISRQFYAPSHAFVFDKSYSEPVKIVNFFS